MTDQSGAGPPGGGGPPDAHAPDGPEVLRYSRDTAGLSSKQAWGTGTMGAVAAGDGEEGDLVYYELERLRSLNAFHDLAQSLPEDSAPRRAAEFLAKSFTAQLFLCVLAYVGVAIAFRVIAGSDVETMAGLNFFLFLYLLGSAIYFSRYGARAGVAAVVMMLVAILAYAVRLTGFRPSIFYLATHPLLTLAAGISASGAYEQAARQGVAASSNRRQLMDLQERQRRVGGKDEEVLHRMKEAEVRNLQIKTQFSDLLNNLRDLGGAIRESDIYSTLFRLLKKGVGAEVAEIWFLAPDGLSLKVEEARTAGGADMMVSDFQGVLPHDGTSIVSLCARQARAILPDAIQSDGALRNLVAKGQHPSSLAFPVLVEGKVQAVVNVSRGAKELDGQQVALLNTISQITSRAFEGAQTFQLSEAERKAAVNLSEVERVERIKTRETLERFVSKNVVDEVMENPKLSSNMEVTILLADLRGFTALSERLPPEVVVEMLNDYFGELTPIIFNFGGTLDKYIGDMVMALFGPPRPTGRDAENAVRCAVEMRRAFDRGFKRKWEPRVRSKLEMGIAMNTGKATVGLLGSERLVNYTAIGDAVNTASRLEDLTPGGRILMTEACFQRVAGVVEAKLVGAKSFKGKSERTKIFEVRGLKARGVPPAAPPAPAPAPAPPPRAPARAAAASPLASGDGAIRESSAPAGDPLSFSSYDLTNMKSREAATQSRPGTAGPPAMPRPAPPPPGPAAAGGPAAGPPCPLCQSPVPAGSQVCPTCGMKL